MTCCLAEIMFLLYLLVSHSKRTLKTSQNLCARSSFFFPARKKTKTKTKPLQKEFSYRLFRERLNKRKEVGKYPGKLRRKTSSFSRGEWRHKGKPLANINIYTSCCTHCAAWRGEQRRVFSKVTLWTPSPAFFFTLWDVGSAIDSDGDKSHKCNENPKK